MKQSNIKSTTIVSLCMPLILAYITASNPIISYLIAWLGSFFIFYFTWAPSKAHFNKDLPISKQLMRPIFLLQFIFAGFMCVSSIFYFLDHIGYEYFIIKNNFTFHENQQTYYIAECQRLNLLAHAALATGIISISKWQKSQKQNFKIFASLDFLIGFSIIFYVSGLILQQINGLLQIAIILNTIAASAGALLFAKGIATKNMRFLIIGSLIFITNFTNATLSGFKEPIIVNVIVLFCLLYPYYKKIILILSLPIIYILFYILPTYAKVIRQSWSGEKTATEARKEALNLLQGENIDDDIDETNWQFLTNRLSEINMFTQFVEYVPEKHDYYGWEIFSQSITALFPRIFWPSKPNIETISMERVYDAGVASRLSSVSAKTRPIVDAYLSWGTIGVFLFAFIYGYCAQWLCNKCEQLYGGYELGCIVMFNSLFQTMWRGNNFEFMFSNIFYGFVMMYLIFYILKSMRVIQPVFSKTPDIPRRSSPFQNS